MILVTGGFGFIGSHTVRALIDQGEECVVVQRGARELPAVLDGEQVPVEQADVTDLDALLAIGRRHDITGIVHLAGSYPWPGVPDAPVETTRQVLGGLLNVVQAAQEWGVRRLGIASTIGVYFGADNRGPLHEDTPLSLSASVSIPTFKKIGELLGGYLADTTGIDIVSYRVSGTWGPLGHADPFFAAPALVHAAARGTAPDFSGQMAAALRGRRARRHLRQGHRPGDRPPAARRPAEPPHVQRRIRPGHDQRAGRRSDREGGSRGPARPPHG